MIRNRSSPEYPVYRPDPLRINASFLSLCLRSGAFMRRLRGTGNTTKQRITPAQFERQRIPLPSLPEQQAMVAAYQEALETAAGLEAEAAAAEVAGLAAFEAALGLSAPAPLPSRPVFIARFAALDRWSHDAALRASVGGGAASSPHPIVRLGDVVADLRVGVSPTCRAEARSGDGWGVLKLSAVTGDRFQANENKAVKDAGAINTALEVSKGDVLIARGSGVTKFVGAASLVEEPTSGLMLCDLIFRAVMPPAVLVDPAFLVAVLRTGAVRRQIEDKRTGAAPGIQKITKPALLSLTFPLPTDLAEQRALTAALDEARATAAGLRARAAARRHDAWAAFETAIYGEADAIRGEGAVADP